ncbi:ROK family protein [Streptomyces paludis]|uniref:ROK family protein n=1 Tax=Streptomyces paludis TaxID=2282738 RepID=A0A345HRV1_9ACTN|nr:ROK family protein [Streptomyces paludis]AXG79425.1 ROK family protein [Streptomyces paludis]
MRHVIALDVGGTGMKAALVGADGALLHEARRATGRERGPDAVVETILGFAAELRAYGTEHLGASALAAGVAVPGIVDAERGVALYASNLGWRDVPLRELLTARLGGVPVALGHDVRTGGLAEGRLGAGRGADRFLFVPLGTGIAGAIGINGVIEAGAHGSAGEIGHVVVRPDGPECGCGQRGCLETLASAGAVSRAWAAETGEPTADAADCAKAVESGDPAALRIWANAVDALAAGLVTALTLLDPRTLIIGGGLAGAGDTLFTPLRAAVEARVTFQSLPEIVPAALGDTAGCLGAGLLAWDLLEAEAQVPRAAIPAASAAPGASAAPTASASPAAQASSGTPPTAPPTPPTQSEVTA